MTPPRCYDCGTIDGQVRYQVRREFGNTSSQILLCERCNAKQDALNHAKGDKP